MGVLSLILLLFVVLFLREAQRVHLHLHHFIFRDVEWSLVVFVLLLAEGLERLCVRQHLHDLQLSVDASDVQSCVVVVTLEGIYLRP